MPTELVSPQDRDRWLAEHNNGIGASEAAAVCGQSRYSNPIKVWQQKTGNADPLLPTFKMRLGLAVEDLIKDEWCQQEGRDLAVSHPPMYAHAEHGFIRATPDAIIDPACEELLECKSTSNPAVLGQQGTDELPTDWLYQAQQQMLVTGAAVVHFAVLVNLNVLKTFVVDRSEVLQQHIIDREAEFWEWVKARTVPPLDWADSQTPSLVRDLYRTVNNVRILFPGELVMDYSRRLEVCEEIKQLEQEKELLTAKMLAAMGEAGSAEFPGIGMEMRRFEVGETHIKASVRAARVGYSFAKTVSNKGSRR